MELEPRRPGQVGDRLLSSDMGAYMEGGGCVLVWGKQWEYKICFLYDLEFWQGNQLVMSKAK